MRARYICAVCEVKRSAGSTRGSIFRCTVFVKSSDEKFPFNCLCLPNVATMTRGVKDASRHTYDKQRRFRASRGCVGKNFETRSHSIDDPPAIENRNTFHASYKLTIGYK